MYSWTRSVYCVWICRRLDSFNTPYGCEHSIVLMAFFMDTRVCKYTFPLWVDVPQIHQCVDEPSPRRGPRGGAAGGAQADGGSYAWKWIPLEQVIFITAPFRPLSVISLITPSAIRGGLGTGGRGGGRRKWGLGSVPCSRTLLSAVFPVYLSQSRTEKTKQGLGCSTSTHVCFYITVVENLLFKWNTITWVICWVCCQIIMLNQSSLCDLYWLGR